MKKTKLFYLFLVFAAMFTAACSDDDDIAQELSLDKTEVALLPDESATVKVKTGNGGYVVKAEDESIAKAMVAKGSDMIKITAVKAGETTVHVTDYKGKKAMVKVVVKAVLTLEKSDVDVVEGGEAVVAIKSGSGKYEVISSDEAAAKAMIDGTNVKITGVAKGNAVVTVKDTDTNVEKKINVIVKSALAVASDNVEIIEGGEKVVEITNGTGNYTVASSDESIASAAINGTKITITAVVAGTAKVTVTDTETNSTVDINVVVKPALSFDEAEITLFEGEEKTITIDKGTGNYSAVSSNEEVATVAVDGKNIKITAVAKGEATVTVTDTDTQEKKEIKVTVKALLPLELSKNETSLTVGAKEEIKIVKGNGDYKVEVDNADIVTAEVKQNGEEYVVALEAKAIGTANVKITDVAGKEATIKVTVKEGLKLAKNELSVKMGETEHVAVVNVTDDTYEFTVEPADVLKVEKGGTDYEGKYVDALVITPLKYHKDPVKVTVKSGGQEAVLMVTVTPVDGINIKKTETELMVGDTEEIRIVSGNGGYKVTVDKAEVVKAEVKLNGEDYVVALEAKAAGMANVTVTDAADKTVTVKVTVKEKVLFDIDENGVVTKHEGAVIKGDIEIPAEGKIIAGNEVSEDKQPFKGNVDVTSVDLNNVTEVRNMAFMGCKGLVKVELRKVTKIAWGAFANCNALAEVYCYMEDPTTVTLEQSVFNNKDEYKSKRTLYVPAASLDAYKASDFKNFFELDNIKPMGGGQAPDADVEIDENGLVYEKEGVELEGDLRVPDAGLKIAKYTGGKKNSPFAYKSKITSIDFNNVTNLKESNCVAKCKDLTTIYLRKVTDIGSGAFYYCTKLKKVYAYMDKAPNIPFTAKKNAFKGIPADAVLYVPKGKKSAYEGTKIAKFFSKIEEME